MLCFVSLHENSHQSPSIDTWLNDCVIEQVNMPSHVGLVGIGRFMIWLTGEAHCILYLCSSYRTGPEGCATLCICRTLTLQMLLEAVSIVQGAGAGNGEPFRAQAIIANPPTYGHLHVAEKMNIPCHIFFSEFSPPHCQLGSHLALLPASWQYPEGHLCFRVMCLLGCPNCGPDQTRIGCIAPHVDTWQLTEAFEPVKPSTRVSTEVRWLTNVGAAMPWSPTRAFPSPLARFDSTADPGMLAGALDLRIPVLSIAATRQHSERLLYSSLLTFEHPRSNRW